MLGFSQAAEELGEGLNKIKEEVKKGRGCSDSHGPYLIIGNSFSGFFDVGFVDGFISTWFFL
jgi:hypothetical protein